MLVEMRMLGEVAAEGARTRLAVEQPKDVARHLIQPPALGEARTPTEQATKDRCYWPKMLIPFFHASGASRGTLRGRRGRLEERSRGGAATSAAAAVG